jgi:predicted DNA-binding transcriptional regulator AlpA
MSRNRYTEAAASATVGPGKLSNSLAYPPRAMRLEQAASYLSISTSSFLRLVDEGALPQATKKHSMALWDRLDLDAAFEDWKTEGGPRENTMHKLLREQQ